MRVFFLSSDNVNVSRYNSKMFPKSIENENKGICKKKYYVSKDKFWSNYNTTHIILNLRMWAIYFTTKN